MNPTLFPWMIAVPLGASPFVYLAGRLGYHKVKLNGRSLLVRGLALLTMLGTWVLFALSWMEFSSKNEPLLFHLDSIWLHADGISFLMAAMVLGLGTFVVMFSGPYIAGEVGEEKYYAMLLAIIGIMVGLGSARDLFNLWMWFEAMAVSSYLLVAFYRERSASLEAGMKYLVQSATGSVLVLLGIALVLGQAGTLDMDQIRSVIASESTAPLSSVACRRALRHWLRCEGGFCAVTHLAARCTLAGSQWDQRHAFGCGHRSGSGRDAAGAFHAWRFRCFVGYAPACLWRVEHVLRELDGTAPETNQANAGVFKPESHRLYIDRYRHCPDEWNSCGGTGCGISFIQSHAYEGTRLPRGRRVDVCIIGSKRNPPSLGSERSVRRGEEVSAGGIRSQCGIAGVGRFTSAIWVYVEVADLCRWLRGFQSLADGIGHLCGVEQCFVAGLLCTCRQHVISPQCGRSCATRFFHSIRDEHPSGGLHIGDHHHWLDAFTHELADTTRRANVIGDVWKVGHF